MGAPPGNRIVVNPAGNVIQVNFNPPAVINFSGISVNVAKLNQLTSILSPNYYEVDGYKEQFRRDDSVVTRVFLVVWGWRKTFMDYMLGWSVNNAGTLSRTIPDQHPLYPWLYAVDASMLEGVGAIGLDPASPSNPLISYYENSTPAGPGLARVQVTYRSLTYEVRDDTEVTTNGLSELSRYVTRYETYALQSIPLTYNGAGVLSTLFFKAGPSVNQAIPTAAGSRLLPTKQVKYTWHDVPDVPEQAISNCQGCVNLNAFDPDYQVGGVAVRGGGLGGAQGYPAQTLLCMSPVKTRHRSPSGRVTWDIEYNFLYRPQGHNNFPAIDGNFYRAEFTNNGNAPGTGATFTGTSLYTAVDFGQLFQVPKPVNYQGPNG